MKKIMMMLALLAIPFAMQAQKFHDVEANEAKGAVKCITTSMMGQEIKTTHTYNADGVVTSDTVDMGGQVMEMAYSNIKLDAHGNWISRTASIMGQEMTFTRTIEYY